MKTIYSFIFFFFSLTISAQEKSYTLDKLTYLANSDVEKGISYSKEKSRPMMIYFNSHECNSCEKYLDKVMSADTIEKYLKSKYVCIKADVKNGDASHFAKKYDISLIPQIVLISQDQSVYYKVEMKLDEMMTGKQAAYFMNVVALKDQIMLYKKTNNSDYDAASDAMAISYAKRDYKKNPSANVDDNIYMRCLNMKMFEKFIETYKMEWEKQKTSKNK
jgi:hypothetical protein